jgi:hypothetical protein
MGQPKRNSAALVRNMIAFYSQSLIAACIKTIESRSFKVSRIRELNDPFEWRMVITGTIPEAESVVNAYYRIAH